MTEMLARETGALTGGEQERLAELEEVIDRAVQSFLEIGRALDEVRDSRLYRETHDTFEDYCRERWGLGHAYAYQVIQASRAATVVSATADMPAPPSERVARELVPLQDDPEAMIQTWEEAVTAHGPKVTAKQVREVRERKRPKPQPIREPPGDPGHDTRFEVIEDAVDLLKLAPAPDQLVFPDGQGDVEALDEALKWLADWMPKVWQAWKAHQAFLRQRDRSGG